MRLTALLLSAALAGALTAAGPAPAAPAPAVFSGSGPAWWHVTRGDSEVWIIGTPDFLPIDQKWDDTTLRAHMQGARAVLYPPDANQLAGRYQATHQDIVWKTLGARLPGGLYRRLADDISLANDRAASLGKGGYSQVEVMDRLDFVPTYQAANQLVRGTTRIVQTGNPVASKAKGLAARQEIPAHMVKAGSALFGRYLATVNVPEADQVACVEKMATDFESGSMTLANHDAGLAAWARGDVAHALQRYSFANNCPFGAIGQHFWDEVTAYDVEAVENALSMPGKTVAVLELKPLLMSNGVLDRLAAGGARVEGPSLAVNSGRPV